MSTNRWWEDNTIYKLIDWRLTDMHSKICILGDSNLCQIRTTPIHQLHVETFPRGKIQHLEVTQNRVQSGMHPDYIILSVGIDDKGVDPDTKVGGTAYMSTQREVLEGQTGSHRAKRANFGRGVRGSSPGKFQKPTWQMVQSTLFLSYICEYY